MKSKKAQEEMVGFAVILIILAIVILIFVSFSLKKSNNLETSFQADNFVQAVLQYTSNCSKYYDENYVDVSDLIKMCSESEECFNSQDSCFVLEALLDSIIKQSWQIGPESPNKGYFLEIIFEENALVSLSEGNITSNFKGSSQRVRDANFEFKVYN